MPVLLVAGWINMVTRLPKEEYLIYVKKIMGNTISTEPIFWASGAALFIRAEVFHEMKGFDEYFFAHQEEIDLCWRMQLAGYKIYSCPASVVYHVGGGTLPRGNSLRRPISISGTTGSCCRRIFHCHKNYG